MRSRLLKKALLVLIVAGCSSGAANVYQPGPPPVAQILTVDVDLTATRQRIDGFGASSAWWTPSISDEQAQMFFSVDEGIGLTHLRLRITPQGMPDGLVTAQKAVALGVTVWAAPWSPPAEWKSNNNVKNGGSLLPAHRQDWADRLAAFAKSMADQGVPLAALSAQNEPNYANMGWETCIWTPADLVTFVRDFLGPALARQGLTLPIVAPETQDWGTLRAFAIPLLDDPVAAAYLGPIAAHGYGGSAYAFPTDGHPLWMTEVSKSGQKLDPGMESGLWAAEKVHESLVNGNVNVFHWWWLNASNRADSTDGSALTEMGQLTRRAWVIANWSRFVRPGFVRVNATARPQADVSASAFTDPVSGRVVVVAINEGEEALSQAFAITGGAVAPMVTPWITSDDLALAAQDPIAVSDGAFSYTLPPRSVTSFVTN